MSTKKKRSRLYQASNDQKYEEREPTTESVFDTASLSEESMTEARAIVKKYAYYASGIGLVPFPVAEVLTVNAVQYAMIRKLAICYGIPFKEQRAKSLISSILSGVVGASIIYGPVTKALTVFTGLGWILGAGVSIGVSGTITLTLGKLFIDHFESGGSFLDLDIESSKARLRAELKSS